MSNKKAKGITVVIDGDLTSLDKALKNTNASLSDVQKNLKATERALKLDPTNVELLDQKQRLLAQNAEKTAEKLKIIQDTMDNSTASNVRYDAWTEAFSSMQREITKAENALADLNSQQKDLKDLGFPADSDAMKEVQTQISATEDRLDALKQKVTDTYEEMGRPISIEQFDRLNRELVEAKDSADKANKAFKNFSPTLEKVGNSAQVVSDKAGKVASALSPLSKAAGGVLAAMAGTVPATDDFRTSLSKLETNAQQAGISLNRTSDALTEFNRVSGDTDASVEALSNLLMTGATESNLQRAVENLAGAAIAFPDTLKIESLADSLQESLASGEATGQFSELLERLGVDVGNFNSMIGQTQDQTVRLNQAMDVLANEGMEAYYNAWLQANGELVENKDATLELQTSLAALAEALTPIVTTFTSFSAKLLDWFADLSPSSQKAVLAILAVAASISPIAGMISNIGGAVSALSKLGAVFAGGVGNTVYATFAKWAVIILAVVAAVTALIAMINVLIGRGEQAGNVLGNLGGVATGSTGAVTRSQGLKGFASGGVFMPNHPVLGVLGDNRNEVEIAAPRSEMQAAFLDALDSRGTVGAPQVNIEFRGSLAQLGRVLQPVIAVETARQGGHA